MQYDVPCNKNNTRYKGRSIPAVGGSVLRASECVSPAEAVPIRNLVTGRLALGGNRTLEASVKPLHHLAVAITL